MDRIGPYELIEKLGSGGMGTVYRARHVETGHIVALKIMRADVGDDPVFVRRFEREAAIARSLMSPNIVATLDAGVDDITPYIVMELVDGESLATYLRRAGPIPVDEAMELAAQIAQGLDVAHSQGVIHRDISPQNILITKDGVAKIADFGIARSQAYATLTATAAFIGKPAYTSPEMLVHGQTDIRGDIYSLGVILFEMLTGRTVFLAPTPMAVMDMHVRQPPPRLEDMGVRVPRHVESILDRCLEKDPDKRYQTPRDLVATLAGQALPAESVSEIDRGSDNATTRYASPPTPPPPGHSGSGNSWKRYWWVPMGAVLSGVSLIALALTLLPAGESQSQESVAAAPTATSVRTVTPSPRRTSTQFPVRRIEVTPEPAHTFVSGTPLGGLSVSGYCISEGFDRATLRRGQVGPEYAFNNWQCVGNGASEPTDIQRACEWEYGRSDVVAQPNDPDDAYTWVCVVSQSSASQGSLEYVLQEGDTMSRVASAYGLTYQDLLAFNGLTDEEAAVLQAGDVILIPQ